MIKRYTRPEMGTIWTDENKYKTWLQVEIAACDAQAELGRIPKDAVKVIKEKASFTVDRIEEIESEVKHDVIAFLTCVAEYVGPESRFIHLGMTSSDLLDTALAMSLKQAGDILLKDVNNLLDVLKEKAIEYKETVCIGRSHGIHAEPTSFGLKFALWYDEMMRNLERLEKAVEAISVGMISGAVGTYAFVDPQVEELTCKNLGLRPVNISTQVIQRDVHAEFSTALALIGGTVEKIAVEIRHLQRTEVLEAEEPFTKGQKGSSAMPHKRNPIASENMSGLVRLLRTNAMAALENVALWHERDISHSSVERVILPDSTIIANYVLNRLAKMLKDLVVYPENMVRNLDLTHGLIFSQPLLLALIDKGITREESYKLVQDCAMKCWKEQTSFEQIVKNDSRAKMFLSNEEISECFNEKRALKQVDYIYTKVGIL
jgi:adenylosuccinate lyase